MITTLIDVRTLLQDPAHWTKGVLASSGAGGQINVNDPTCTCWCLVGAFGKITGEHISSIFEIDHPAALFLLKLVRRSTAHKTLTMFNDKSTHSQVISMLDYAIWYANQEKIRIY